MIKLISGAMKEMLKEGAVVKFIGDFTKHVKNGSTFVVERTAQIVYEQGYIIQPSDTITLDLSSIGLYPENLQTLYEILVSFKGGKDVLTYIQIPAGKYLSRLEKATFYPNPKNPELRYLGHIGVDDTPYKDPRLRIHTVKDLEPVLLQFYNDGPQDEKIIIKFLVNKCKIEPIEETITPTREIIHYDLLRW